MDEVQKKKKVGFIVEPKSLPVKAAMVLMLVSILFRLIGCVGLWGDPVFRNVQILLPIASSILFIVFLFLFGKRALWTTILPVMLGVIFFVLKSFTFTSVLHTGLCILLYCTVAVLYTCTVTGVIGTKVLLFPLFGLPFIYHIAVEDYQALKANELTFSAGMQEMSVLCIMAALFLLACAMKRKGTRTLEEMNLPGMRGPKNVARGTGGYQYDDETGSQPQAAAENETGADHE